MTAQTTVAVGLALLGSALIGGVFFAFSSFIMQALAGLPAAQGIAAMQSINTVVLNRSFLGLFVGTTIACLTVVVLTLIDGFSASPWLLAGATQYVMGTFLVTGLGNVPLNNRLKAVASTDPEATDIWNHYVVRWTQLNTIRTAAALGAAGTLLIGLVRV